MVVRISTPGAELAAIVEFRTDVLADARPLAAALSDLGFQQIRVRRRDPAVERGGVWGRGALARNPAACAQVEAVLVRAGLALESVDSGLDEPAFIALPAPVVRPLRVSTDDPVRAARLLAPLSPRRIDALPRPPLGAVLRYGRGSAPAAAAVRPAVDRALSALGASPLARLVEAPVLEEPAAEMHLELPCSGLDAGTMARRLHAAAPRLRIRVCTAAPALGRALEGALGPHPFGALQICWERRSEPRITYGAAPEHLIQCLIEVVEVRTGIRCERDRSSDEDSEEVILDLPDRAPNNAEVRVERALVRVRAAVDGEQVGQRERRMAALARALSDLAAEHPEQPLDVGAALDTLVVGHFPPSERGRIRGLLLAAGVS